MDYKLMLYRMPNYSVRDYEKRKERTNFREASPKEPFLLLFIISRYFSSH